ncbi:Fur family transcriptional regulator [uncultured Desulfuromusa sp.]|uniref:Fur family transcriptional regulator n=1 Tax=uncultured Desulfuromusa sp. TaxID=219183 RepID=UPI002AA8E8CB|nr:Fur family transcriptional regulator [uncultured Desulfuromusa sp.]
MKDSQSRLDDILTKLRERNCRITSQRIAIIEAFLNSDKHPSVEMVYEEVRKTFRAISLATVYKTVSLLKELEEILEIGFSSGHNRYDGKKPYPHPHLICSKCNTIIEPDIDLLDQITAEIEKLSGYQILSSQLEFFGVCPSCQKQRK